MPRKPGIALLFALSLSISACGGEDPQAAPPTATPPPASLQISLPSSVEAPLLGGGPGSITFTTITSKELNRPSDLAFNPRDKTELWVVNLGDDSTVIIDNPGAVSQKQERHQDKSRHFLNNPTSMAFADDLTFATCHETDNDYNGLAAGNYFMGPTRWTADRKFFNSSTESHLDMVHHTPWCMGIAWEKDAVYWAFNGHAGSLDKTDFGMPHPDKRLGGSDHTDGRTWRYATGKLRRLAGVPSHLELDHATGTLYVNDTGNARLIKLDTRSKGQVIDINGYHKETPLGEVRGVPVTEVIGASSGLLRQPSGLLLHGGMILVGDHATGLVHAFTPAGKRVNTLDTGLGKGRLTGLTAGPDGALFFLDGARSGKVLRADVKSAASAMALPIQGQGAARFIELAVTVNGLPAGPATVRMDLRPAGQGSYDGKPTFAQVTLSPGADGEATHGGLRLQMGQYEGKGLNKLELRVVVGSDQHQAVSTQSLSVY